MSSTETLDRVANRNAQPGGASRVGTGLAIAWIALIVLCALLANLLPLHSADAIDATMPSAGPSSHHWVGTDALGRDILSRLIFGARISLVVGLSATILSAVTGTLVGMVAGYLGRAVDSITMTLVDVLLAFPPLILAISLTAFLGPSVLNVVIAIAILTFPPFVRISRAQAASFTQREFVRAARSLGAKRSRVLLREVAPNVLPSVLSYVFVVVAIAIVIESALSFLGLGVSPSTPTWGGMIAAGKDDLELSPHISMIPALALFLTVLSLSTLAEFTRTSSPQR